MEPMIAFRYRVFLRGCSLFLDLTRKEPFVCGIFFSFKTLRSRFEPFGSKRLKRARSMRATVRQLSLRVRAHSHTRSTVHPVARSARETARSRCTFLASFALQYAARERGIWPWIGHTCQKHPSTNNATRSWAHTKSGEPASLDPRRQPVRRCARSKRISLCSVVALPLLRTSAIIADRRSFVKISPIMQIRCSSHCRMAMQRPTLWSDESCSPTTSHRCNAKYDRDGLNL